MEEKNVPEVKKAEETKPQEIKKEAVAPKQEKVNTLFSKALVYRVNISNKEYTFMCPDNLDYVTAKLAAHSFLGQLDVIKEANEKLYKKQQEEAAKKVTESQATKSQVEKVVQPQKEDITKA